MVILYNGRGIELRLKWWADFVCVTSCINYSAIPIKCIVILSLSLSLLLASNENSTLLGSTPFSERGTGRRLCFPLKYISTLPHPKNFRRCHCYHFSYRELYSFHQSPACNSNYNPPPPTAPRSKLRNKPRNTRRWTCRMNNTGQMQLALQF